MVIAIAVIAIALGGTLAVMNRTVRGSADPMLLEQSVSIAEAYLEEILLRSYYDPDLGAGGGACPGPEGSRPLYDNVCDYDALDDADAIDQSGTAMAGLSSYRVRVEVDAAANLGGLAGSAEVLRVDVRVSHSDRVDITLSGYRGNY
jgi:MSHA pilin protein MshD